MPLRETQALRRRVRLSEVRAAIALSLVLLVPAAVSAEVDPRGFRAGAPVAARRWVSAIGTPELQRALDGARDEVRECLEREAGGARARARVTVRITPQRRLSISATVRPRAAEGCVDLAVRRYVQPLLVHHVVQASASLEVTVPARRGVPPPPPHSPQPPPTPPPLADESEVHAVLEGRRGALFACVPRLADEPRGRMTLRLRVLTDGSLVLMGVTIPDGVRDPLSLRCLSMLVAGVRVSPPPTESEVVHHVDVRR